MIPRFDILLALLKAKKGLDMKAIGSGDFAGAGKTFLQARTGIDLNQLNNGGAETPTLAAAPAQDTSFLQPMTVPPLALSPYSGLDDWLRRMQGGLSFP